jgi:hypothetical protein
MNNAAWNLVEIVSHYVIKPSVFIRACYKPKERIKQMKEPAGIYSHGIFSRHQTEKCETTYL